MELRPLDEVINYTRCGEKEFFIFFTEVHTDFCKMLKLFTKIARRKVVRKVFLSCVVLMIFAGGLSAQESLQPSQGETDSNYVIGEEDVLSITVRNEPEFSLSSQKVRLDGRITIPMLGDIYVNGKTTKQLEEEIAERLKFLVVDPVVIVIVDVVYSQRVTVAGNVAKPGHYSIGTPSTVLDILVRAGQPNADAKVKNIQIVRIVNGREVHFSFNYKDVIRGKNLRQNILLENRDYILVP